MNYKIFVKPKKNNNYIVSLLVGRKVKKEWESFSKDLCVQYCKNNKIGMIVIYKNFIKRGANYSNPVFNKFLFGDYLKNNLKFIKNVCYLDHDILCNPLAPNIFNFLKSKKFNVVSKYKNTPYPQTDDFLKRRAAFFRKKYYQESFPLDSALTITRRQTYKYHKWPDLGDYFCSGLIMFNLKNHSKFLKKIFEKYEKSNLTTLTKGEEPIMNYELIRTKKINWLNYKFQVLWLLEMNSKYPFLYKFKNNRQLIKECILNSLSENYFIHFSGKWPEGQMWKIRKILSKKDLKFYKKFNLFLKRKLKSKPRKELIKFYNK